MASSGDESSGDGFVTSSSEDEDDYTLSERFSDKKGSSSSRRRTSSSEKPTPRARKRESSADRPTERKKRTLEVKKRWNTLQHNGVLFPPEYEPHGVKLLYDGEPVDLTPEQEEAATFFAVMMDTDYAKKPTFVKNFWEDFQALLGDEHTIQEFDRVDFTPIRDWNLEEKQKIKDLPKEVKKERKEEKMAAEEKYKTALVDGQPEQVGNFRVEPPGLFRGRGEHPKMGKIKKRIYPQDITINISPGAPIPHHPYPDQSWKEIRHDNTVTWLAFWKDPISPKDFKYVFLAANSTFKSESDMAKYEKARKLKEHIDRIRSKYRADWTSQDPMKRQMGTALYFIDRLALRAGHEKDMDEADTVGCCTLKVENVECVRPRSIKFDFLGKDSIRYENVVEVEAPVFKNVQGFCAKRADGKRKHPSEQLFDLFDAQDLNKELKELMDGLSAKVFRTYNASITLQQQLERDLNILLPVDRKKAEYDEANKQVRSAIALSMQKGAVQVAILCNHQRAVPKTHDNQIERLTDKVSTLDQEIHELEQQIRDLRHASTPKEQKQCETLKKRRDRKQAQKEKTQVQMANKESMKSVALGTSKINYLDPRITVAWCKRSEMPIEKIFNNSLLQKFGWAMTASSEFEF